MRCYPPDKVPATVLDYPRGSPERASAIATALEDAGVKEVCLEGPAPIPGGYRVLGRGHAAVVLLAFLEGVGHVAVKVRRADSKRDSLMLECETLRRAWPVAPRVYWCTDEFIIMDLVEGEPVAEVARSIKDCEEAIALIAKVAEAARWLDRVGVCHEELSDLRGHAFIVDNSVRFIDFESASMRYCCTLCKVMSWVLHRSDLTSRFHELGAVRDSALAAIRLYKRSPSREHFMNLVKVFAQACT